jgi:hypothetical protein
MSQRAVQLQATADRQIAELAKLLSTAGNAGLAQLCVGREKFGDGTVGTVAEHTIDNYHRIAEFVAADRDGGDRGHPGPHAHADHSSRVELDALLAKLEAAQDALAALGALSEEQLDSVPPAGRMKFADGQRTLDQILANLLKHQRHQLTALVAGLS